MGSTLETVEGIILYIAFELVELTHFISWKPLTSWWNKIICDIEINNNKNNL